MNKSLIILLFLIILVIPAQSQTISMPDQNLSPGSQVLVPVILQNLTNIGAITLFIGYDPLVLEYDTFLNVSSQAPGLMANNMVALSQVGIVWSAFTTGVNFGNTILCNLRFTYLGGECPLLFKPGCDIADFNANPVNVTLIPGSLSETFDAVITGMAANYCLNEPVQTLSGTPAGGLFFVDGLQQTEFHPGSLGTGTHEVIYIFENNYGFSDTATQSVTIHNLPEFTLDIAESACFGSMDGSAGINMIAGNSPYSFLWNNGSTTSEITSQMAGEYSFTVTDLYCTVSGTASIGQPLPLSLDFSLNHASSVNQSDGSAEAFATGGTEPYVYSWSSGQTGNLVNSLSEGYYYVTLTDAHLCSITDTIRIRAFASQTLNLPQQWSIFSFNVDVPDNNVSTLFSSLLPNLQLIKSENGLPYWPEYQLNQLGSIFPGEGYQIRMTTATQHQINGFYIHPEELTISLPSGWSLFGYLRISPAPLTSMLAPVLPSVVIIKNSNGSAFWPAYSLNQIGNLNPGEGYQIRMNTSASFNYPAN